MADSARGDYHVDLAALRHALTGPAGPAVQLVYRLSRRIANNARQRAPVDTGNLRRSIQQEPVRIRDLRVTGGVTARAVYSAAVHDGWPRRFIRPVRRKALSWVGPDGKRYFSKGHWVGPSRPRPFLRLALEEEARRAGFRTGN